jgi:hypothetical protein
LFKGERGSGFVSRGQSRNLGFASFEALRRFLFVSRQLPRVFLFTNIVGAPLVSGEVAKERHRVEQDKAIVFAGAIVLIAVQKFFTKLKQRLVPNLLFQYREPQASRHSRL